MPFVNAKCTNCGASLEVDNTKDAAVCQYCGTAFVVEKAINNYNTTNNIQAGVVNTYGDNSADFVITAGKLLKYNGTSSDVVIPNTVKEIGTTAFYGCWLLTSITIPDSVTEIGDGSFDGCSSLTSIIISNSMTAIDYYSFNGRPINIINASDDWKMKYSRWFDCLREPEPENKGGCMVAICVYGSYDCAQAWTLCRFRDNTLAETILGRAFIHIII